MAFGTPRVIDVFADADDSQGLVGHHHGYRRVAPPSSSDSRVSVAAVSANILVTVKVPKVTESDEEGGKCTKAHLRVESQASASRKQNSSKRPHSTAEITEKTSAQTQG